jgi:hypothetical protein
MTGHAIHIKLDGRTYSGTYKVDRQLLTVTTSSARSPVRWCRESLMRHLPKSFSRACPGGEGPQRLNALIRI